MEFPTIDKFAKDVAEKALDEYVYDGKTMREWVEVIAKQQPCEDCISREAVLEQIDDWRKNEFLRVTNPLHYLRKRISSLPSVAPQPKAEQKWIPVSERLPDYGVSVLTWDGYCYCVEKRIPYIRDEDGEPISSDWWVSDEYDECDSDYYPNLRDGACIAWMPLPKPYKAESEDNK